MNKEIVFNAMLDWRKKDIDKFDRAVIIQEYMNEHRLSIRQLALQLAIPKSTIEDWLLFNRISQKDYNNMRKRGMTPTDVYKTLRLNKQSSKGDYIDMSKLDFELDQGIRRLRGYERKNNIEFTKDTEVRIKELLNILNRILLHNELNIKKGGVKR